MNHQGIKKNINDALIIANSYLSKSTLKNGLNNNNNNNFGEYGA